MSSKDLLELDEMLTCFDFHILTQDPSRMVREGLWSILDPLKASFSPYIVLNILGIGIAYYCLLPIELPIGLPIGHDA